MGVTGPKAVEYVQDQSKALASVAFQLNCSLEQLDERVGQLLSKKKSLEKELKQRKKTGSAFNVKSLVDGGQSLRGHTVVVQMTEARSMDELKDLGDVLLNGLKSGVGVLGAEGEKPMLVVVVSSNLVEGGMKAGDLAKKIGSVMGGGGGGKPHMATAGGKNSKALKSAIDASFEIIKDTIEK